MPRLNRIAILIAGGALLLVARSGEAQQSPRVSLVTSEAEIIDTELSVSRVIQLAPVTMAELLGGGAIARTAAGAAPRGSTVALGTWSSSGASVRTAASDPRLVERNVESAWQLRVERTQRRQQHMDVSYVLRSVGGSRNVLGHATDRGSQILVRLEPIAPTVVGYEEGADIVSGGVSFYLDLSRVRRPGRHQGTLTVTFNNL